MSQEFPKSLEKKESTPIKVKVLETANRGDGKMVIEQISENQINLSATRTGSSVLGVSLEFRLENESKEKITMLRNLLSAARADNTVQIEGINNRLVEGDPISMFVTRKKGDDFEIIKLGTDSYGDFHLSLDFDRVSRQGSVVYKIEKNICPNFFTALQQFLNK